MHVKWEDISQFIFIEFLQNTKSTSLTVLDIIIYYFYISIAKYLILKRIKCQIKKVQKYIHAYMSVRLPYYHLILEYYAACL